MLCNKGVGQVITWQPSRCFGTKRGVLQASTALKPTKRSLPTTANLQSSGFPA
ncbi:hypothetical protein RB6884 [Rhodopirellula baltica SH 1]|uniref:Uncharacterized protein n=1 Tax=Rhodopirellula baltica (strain DSM 10527 / NCIMB 13988 / SH1) TaxID=243090 RepID=Q7UPK2_RHOBA|nr:hypothetical protein RB6884 [Rhodopirellula baltica SH 1]